MHVNKRFGVTLCSASNCSTFLTSAPHLKDEILLRGEGNTDAPPGIKILDDAW